MDALSDPRDESKWSADDLISMGFLNTPELMALLDDTPKLSELDLEQFDALVVCGEQSPMFTCCGRADLARAIVAFYEAEKPTAVLCHGTCALLDIKTSDGGTAARRQLHRWGLLRAFAVRDGNLIAGQQQYSGAKVARLVIESLGV